ncbi:MAG TPA: hypothetical protein VFY45_06715 [Baekduia sp.]|nr:hypothetical protein [Baekduia sp.]
MLSKVRLLVLVFAALCAAGATANAAAASKPAKAKRCAAGKVRVVAGGPCVKVVAPKAGAVVEASSALRRDARFRRLAGVRGTKRAEALVKAGRRLNAQARPAKAARRARAASAAAAPVWTPVDVGGVPGRQRHSVQESDGATPTQVIDAETEMTQKAEGATLTISVLVRHTITLSACPDAAGTVTGSAEELRVERKTIVRGKEKAGVEQRVTTRAKITGQVGDDARIASATYAGTVDIEVRGTGAPTARYLVNWNAPAPLPDAPRTSVYDRVKADPAGMLAGSYRGPKGAKLTDAEGEMLVQARIVGQTSLEDEVANVLKLIEASISSETGGCVEVVLDPRAVTLAAGQTQTFSATARAKDGTPVGGATKIIALDATADPEAAAMVAGTPLTFRVTMGDKDKARLVVEVAGKRGKGSTLLEIPRSKGWDVTFTATGDFTRTRTEHSDTDTTTAALSWTTPFRAVRFDGGSYDPLAETAVSGTLRQEGTLGDGHYTCDSTPVPGMATLLTEPAGGGTMRVTIMPFSGVMADMATEQCVREGYGGDYGTIDAILHTAPYVARVTITPELLSRAEFSLPVVRGADFPANCDERAEVVCTETGEMAGTVRFVRR